MERENLDYKQKLKENISILIENEKLNEAKELLELYEQVENNDIESYSMKGVIAMMEGDLGEAERVLKEGLSIDENNFDLLYNLGYLYHSSKREKLAIASYKKAIRFSKEEKDLAIVSELLKELEIVNDNSDAFSEEYNECGTSNCDVIIKNTDEKSMTIVGDNIFDYRESIANSFLDVDAPLVSIYVLAFNNLEKYTKTCVECILKYTKEIDYELILVDNGSSDGTFEYFKSVSHRKKKIIKVTKNIGAYEGTRHAIAASRGKYIVSIANDLYVTNNWLKNMLQCALSDTRIGMVNPMSDYVSNNQSVDLGYKDFDDMQRKAAKFNISNPRKWHERLRLIILGTLFKKECLDGIGFVDYGFIHDFADDDLTFRVRRAGYKAVLCKDVFISHAGKISDKGSDFAIQSLEKGRKIFKDKYFGIDAWDDVNNYETNMISLIDERQGKSEYDILGIDVLCGTPLLEAKNALREKGFYNTRLAAFTTEGKYWLDLSTICGSEIASDRIEYINEYYKQCSFDYIIMGRYLNEYGFPLKNLNRILELIKDDGSLILKINNEDDLRRFLAMIDMYKYTDRKNTSYIGLEELSNYLESKGYFIEKALSENHSIDDQSKKNIFSRIRKICDVDAESIFDKMLVKDYTIKVSRKLI